MLFLLVAVYLMIQLIIFLESTDFLHNYFSSREKLEQDKKAHYITNFEKVFQSKTWVQTSIKQQYFDYETI